MRAAGVLLPVGVAARAAREPPALSAEVRQYRNDVALRRLSVTVTGGGGVPLSIRGVRLVAPGFGARTAHSRPSRRPSLWSWGRSSAAAGG